MSKGSAFYDDGRVVCDNNGLRIRWYYPWGAKTIPYRAIRALDAQSLSRWRGKWRLWGSGDLVHLYNLDTKRPRKTTAIALDTGGHVRAMITPDDPGEVARIITAHLGA